MAFVINNWIGCFREPCSHHYICRPVGRHHHPTFLTVPRSSNTSLVRIPGILIWLDSFPLLHVSQRTWTGHYFPISPNCSKQRHVFPFNRLKLFFSEKRRFENRFCCLFSGSLWWSWVIIRIEIKMKSCVSVSSNLPRVIDRSNLSPSHFAAQW